jgi:hypothetical protein
MDGIGRGPIISAVFGGAVEIERGAALPSGDDALAEFAFVTLPEKAWTWRKTPDSAIDKC